MATRQTNAGHTKARAKSAAMSGAQVRDRVKELSVGAFRDRRLKLSDVSRLVHDVLEGAVEGIDAEVHKPGSGVLGDVFDGLRDGVHSIAAAGSAAAKEVRARGRQIAEKDVPAASRRIRTANDEFIGAVKSFAGKSRKQVRDELHDLVARAERTGPRVKSSAKRAASAADGHLGELSGETIDTGGRLARKAVQAVAMGAGGLLEGLAEAIAPPPRRAARPAARKNKKPAKKTGVRTSRKAGRR